MCETPPTDEGVPLHGNVTISFCLAANPFTPITNSNWKFESNRSDTHMTQNLPDGVSTYVQATSHQYKKYVQLMFTGIQEKHYGVYTLMIGNQYNTENLIHVFNLLPEGKIICNLFLL